MSSFLDSPSIYIPPPPKSLSPSPKKKKMLKKKVKKSLSPSPVNIADSLLSPPSHPTHHRRQPSLFDILRSPTPNKYTNPNSNPINTSPISHSHSRSRPSPSSRLSDEKLEKSINDVNADVDKLTSYMDALRDAGIPVNSTSTSSSPRFRNGEGLFSSSPVDSSCPPSHSQAFDSTQSQSASSYLLDRLSTLTIQPLITEQTFNSTIRGSGGHGDSARVRRRSEIVHPDVIAFNHDVEKKAGIKYYKHSAERRVANLHMGKNTRTAGTPCAWDERTNETPFVSSVPTTMLNSYPCKKGSVKYRTLADTIRTLDNVGTRAASPTHLIWEDPNGRNVDLKNVESITKKIWEPEVGGEGGLGDTARSGGTAENGKVKRPSDWLIGDVLF